MQPDQTVLDKTRNANPDLNEAQAVAENPAALDHRNEAGSDAKFDHQVPYDHSLPPQAPAGSMAGHQPSLPADSLFDTSTLDPTGKTEGLLTEYALQQLQLRSQPFVGASADGELFADELTYSQINEIRQLLIDGESLIMLEGELGAGKTTLLKQLTKTTGQRLQFFSVKGGDKYTTHNLFNGILNAWQLETQKSFDDATHEMILALQAVQERNNLVVLLFDDVDQIPARELNVLVAALQYFNTDETIIRMVMTAEPAFETNSQNMLQKDLTMDYVSIFVEPMLATRALPYIQLRLNQSGHFDNFPLNDKQVAAIANDASGLPGRINFLSAETLNHQYSPFDNGVTGKSRLAQLASGSAGRLLLGFLALGLIVAGLLWRSPGTSEDDQLRTVERAPLSPTASSETSGTQESANTTTNDASQSSDTATVAEESVTSGPDAQSEDSTTAEAAENDNLPDTDSSEISTNTVAADSPAENASDVGETTANTDTGDDVSDTTATPDASADSAVDSANESSAEDAIEEPAQPDQAPADTVAESDSEAAEESAEAPAEDVAATDASADTSNSNTESTENVGQAADSQPEQSEQQSNPSATEDSDAEIPVEPEPPEANTEDTATAAADVQADDVSGIESPNWVLLQDTGKFTIQMSASTARVDVTRFLDRSGLDGPNSIYSFERSGKTWFALVHGLFDSVEDARAAIETMQPTAVSNQPWIRRISSIQRALKN